MLPCLNLFRYFCSLQALLSFTSAPGLSLFLSSSGKVDAMSMNFLFLMTLNGFDEGSLYGDLRGGGR